MINLQRIMIVGRPGSGKSTFAVLLQKILDIPLFHLDKYFFIEHWILQEYETFLSIQKELVAKPCWIIDGNSSRSFDIRYREADLCLFFNLPKWLCYWRVFKRLFSKSSEIDDRAPLCKETVRWSLLSYMWNYEQRIGSVLNGLKNKYPK